MAEKQGYTPNWIVAALVGVGVGGALGYWIEYSAAQTEKTQMAAQAQARLDAVIHDANAKLDAANKQQQALAQQDLPVRVTKRPSLLGHGMVTQIQNFGGNQLALRVTAHSAATNQQREWRIVLGPNQSQELGQQEGWAFAVGDELDLFEDGYRPMKVRVQ